MFSTPFRVARVLLALALVSLAAPRPAHAQSLSRPRTGLGLSAGVAQFDMSGTGTAAFGALRLEHELTSWLVADGSLGILRPDEQFSERRTYLAPEAQVQVQFHAGPARPYLGAGIGMLKTVSGTDRTYGIFSGSAGARVPLSHALDARAELRVTGQSATLAQWTLGLTRRF